MDVRAAIPAETRPGERRVAAVPETVRLLRDAGFEVAIQSGAGEAAGFLDSDYVEAGAEIAGSAAEESSRGADAVLSVQPLSAETFGQLAAGCVTVSFLPVLGGGAALDSVRGARDAGAPRSLELVPRISRAQSMDALTSQALVAGYRCVAGRRATRLPAFFPLLMTAAGTVPPARGARARRRRRRPAGDRHRQAARRHRQRVRRAAGRRPTRSARWAPRSSTSTSTPSRAPAATPGRWPRTAPSASASCSRRTSPTPTSLITTAARPRPAGAAAGHAGDGRRR